MHSSLSDVVAAEVRKHRERLGLTREQLAERCATIGYPELSYAAITNIETGRKHKDTGKRRREITVDELMVLGYALAVPPLLLTFPVGTVGEVPLPPKANQMHPHWGWKWAAGFEPPGVLCADGRIAEAGGSIGTYEDVTDAWRAASYPLQMYQQEQAAADTLREALRELNFARRGHGEDSNEYQAANARRLEAFRKLAEVLNGMMRAGIRVPAFTPDWADELKALGVLDHPEALPVLTSDGQIVRGGGEG
ncbi:helix-turn-helix transcriptional regulator [Streptomyces sp. PmtA]|uniref:helix-turn-helix domain-containing protein n=1 Tax=Streptomyces sp. PmtA TaxID=3074275 RepID=UPI003014868D